MAFQPGYILAFAILIAAGIVGVVIIPTAARWEIDERAPAWPWAASQVKA
jgi:hypothetical protein